MSHHDGNRLRTDYRYVKLPFRRLPSPGGQKLLVSAPSLPAQAVGGHYMLFVVDEDGVPSEAKHVQLRLQGSALHAQLDD